MNGLCDVWRNRVEDFVIFVYYGFYVLRMMKIIFGVEFYDLNNKLLSVILWGLFIIYILLYFCVLLNK